MTAEELKKKYDLRIERFAREYVIDLNGEKAAIRAGYAPRAAHVTASRLLKKAKVQEIISGLTARQADKLEIKAENVLRELSRMGFANMLDYVRTDGNGDVFVDLANLTREQAAAIQEITVEEYMDGRGPQARNVKSTRFKLTDKRGSLELLGKHLKLFTDRTELTGKDGGPIETKAAAPDYDNLTLEELQDLKRLHLKLSGKEGGESAHGD